MLRNGFAAILHACLSLACLLLAGGPANAQYSMINTPLQSAGSGYYSNINLGWSVAGRGWNFNWNGGNTTPQFGGGNNLNGDAQFGGAFGGGPFSGGFRLTAGQGSDTTLGSQSANVMVPNGGFGFFSDTTQRPFVTGIVPVVGSYSASPLQEKVARLHALQQAGGANAESSSAAAGEARGMAAAVPPTAGSSAERGQRSIAEIRAAQVAADDVPAHELAAILLQADVAAARGKPEIARIYYRQALKRVAGDARAGIEYKLQALGESGRR